MKFRKNNGGSDKTFCGLSQTKLEDVQYTLCALDDSIDITEDERYAMGVAIQVISHIANVIQHGEKLHFD